jgi:hypothetical protein
MRTACVGMFLMMLMAPAAMAQTGKHLAIGGGIGVTRYADKDFSAKNPGFSIMYRLNLKSEAPDGWYWGPKGDAGWSKRETSTDIGGARTPLGKLQTILIMGGIQRSLRQRPWQLGIAIVGGAAIHDFEVDHRARDAYVSRLGSDLANIKVKNTIAVRPEAQVNYDLSKWLGVQGQLSYLYDRPKAETTSGGVTTSTTWKTDHLAASIGLVVGIF